MAFFVLRKRLRKTLFHERKKCLCVRMNEHSVLLKPGGDWRRPCQSHVLTLTLRGVSPQTSTKITDVPSCLYPLERVLWAINLQDNPPAPTHHFTDNEPYLTVSNSDFGFEELGTHADCSYDQ